MLEKLNIKNVALIKSLEINFQSGFNVILGETGAGKSIIIDSLNFALGSKADKTLIRAGEETMAVSALFVDVSNNVKSILCGFGLDESDEVLLSRTYSQTGKGEARINGEIVAISMLKQIGEALVDSYGQNESIALLKQKNHLEILDLYKTFWLTYPTLQPLASYNNSSKEKHPSISVYGFFNVRVISSNSAVFLNNFFSLE